MNLLIICKELAFRVANYNDYVPSLPPSIDGPDGYYPVGQSFLINFYVSNGFFPSFMYPIDNHSMANYQVVMINALYRTPQVWVGSFVDRRDSDRMIASIAPTTSDMPEWSDILLSIDKKYNPMKFTS